MAQGIRSILSHPKIYSVFQNILCAHKGSFKALKPYTLLLIINPCLDLPISKFLIKIDRGKYVRTAKEYSTIVSRVFNSSHLEIRPQRWISSINCFMECIAP